MSQLTEKEWLMVNDIIKDIYTAETIREMEESFLLLIRKLVPYKIGVFSIVNEDYTVDENQSVVIGDGTESMHRYNEFYVQHDYTNDILSYPKSTVYCDTDIIDPEKKKQIIFYRYWMQPSHLDYSGGMLIRCEGHICACVTMFRSEIYGQLKEKELFVLELFIGHLENILNGFFDRAQKSSFKFDSLEGYELLSARECEILPFILKGYSNSDLAEKFGISDSTAKKHVYNILVKVNAKSRGELIKKCFD